MSRLGTRLKKLEARLTDCSRLIVHSPAWFDYWGAKAARLLRGEDDLERIPLAYIDALLHDASLRTRLDREPK
jgi:hypothetical protein